MLFLDPIQIGYESLEGRRLRRGPKCEMKLGKGPGDLREKQTYKYVLWIPGDVLYPLGSQTLRSRSGQYTSRFVVNGP